MYTLCACCVLYDESFGPGAHAQKGHHPQGDGERTVQLLINDASGQPGAGSLFYIFSLDSRSARARCVRLLRKAKTFGVGLGWAHLNFRVSHTRGTRTRNLNGERV